VASKYNKILVIGSGPIVIGQAAEFDYAGTQACKSLKEEGIETILVNSNPATIMTDKDTADKVYIEPLTVPVLTEILKREQPDALLPTLGGQTALNLAVDLAEAGVLEKYNVKLIGSTLNTIKQAEDRELFRDLLTSLDEPTPPGVIVESITNALKAKESIGLPVVVRPAFTLGGTGGGIATTDEEFILTVKSGLAASPINQILIEKSIVGWKELEYEVMRDSADNCITICNMENIDPMGVHTGDSIVVAPSQTLSDADHQMLRSSSLKIIRALGIEGGCNVQFALAPGDIVGNTLTDDGRQGSSYYVIEVNPRVSRSSALASKATGYPIARVAAKIAIGKTLDTIENAITKKTFAAFEPALDYCVIKIPRWPFDKFDSGDRILGTQMKATGEIMAIERSFEAAIQKAIRSLEITNQSLLWEHKNWTGSDADLTDSVIRPNDQRLWALLAILRRGTTPEKLSELTGIDPWFTRSFNKIVTMERRISTESMNKDLLLESKKMGFSDETIGILTETSTEEIRNLRLKYELTPVYKMVDTCAAEFEAITPYYYSTYEEENEAIPIAGKKAIVLGSGPIRIGQGIEFDYCSVHAATALRDESIKSIMINSNPETVSTDFDTSDRLYIEPLDEESLLDILDNENSDITTEKQGIAPSIVQFGGQTAINLSQVLEKYDLPILGSSAQAIDTASDRHLFEQFLKDINIPNPPGATAINANEAVAVAETIGYPVLVRPSYVLGGRAMEIVHNATELTAYMNKAIEIGGGKRILIDKYLAGKEVEVDVVCDGDDILIPGIIEHIERAGVHSGDSMAIYPGLNLSKKEVETIISYTTKIGQSLKIKGLMNIQYVIVGGDAYRSPSSHKTTVDTQIYVIEVNPRSSRTIPFISKITGVPMIKLAIQVMLNKPLKSLGFGTGLYPKQNLVGVKAPVFSMSKLTGVDTYVGPEMKSTGEVMGIDINYEFATNKALIAANLILPSMGSILLSISDQDKNDSMDMIKKLHAIGYSIFATKGTASLINDLGIPVIEINKRLDGNSPNVVDIINNQTVDAVINTVTGHRDVLQDGFHIRRAATERRIPCFTSLDTARTAIECLISDENNYNVKTIVEYQSYGKGEK